MHGNALDQHTDTASLVETHNGQQTHVSMSVAHAGTQQTHTMSAADESQQVQQQSEGGCPDGFCPQNCVPQPEVAATFQHVNSTPQIDEGFRADCGTEMRERIDSAMAKFQCLRAGHQAWVSICNGMFSPVSSYLRCA